MAKLSDVPKVVKTIGVKGILTRVWAKTKVDSLFTWSSALAYSWIFAVFPFLVALLTLVPYLPFQTREKAMVETSDAVYQTLGYDTGQTIVENINQVVNQTQGGLLSIGLILAIWSASGGMSMTMDALDRCYEVKSERSFIRQRGLAILLTLASTAGILIVLFLLPVGGTLTAYFKDNAILGPAAVIIIDILRYVIAIGLLFGIVSMLYYFAPNIKQKWQSVTPGAALAVFVWLGLGLVFGIYVSKFGNFNKAYGTLGAAIILLLFFYLSATVLLVGAEINSVIDFVVLGVEPGTRDFTQPTKPSDGIQTAKSPENKAVEARAPAKPAKAGEAPPKMVHAPAGWWKWAGVAIVGTWMLPHGKPPGKY